MNGLYHDRNTQRVHRMRKSFRQRGQARNLTHNLSALLLSLRHKDAVEMLEETTDYMRTMERSVAGQVGRDEIEKWSHL